LDASRFEADFRERLRPARCRGACRGGRAQSSERFNQGRYNRYSYDAEKRQALEAWVRHVEALTSGGQGATIIPLTAAGRDVIRHPKTSFLGMFHMARRRLRAQLAAIELPDTAQFSDTVSWPITGTMNAMEPPDTIKHVSLPSDAIFGNMGGPTLPLLPPLLSRSGLLAAIEQIFRAEPELLRVKARLRDDLVKRRLHELSLQQTGSPDAYRVSSEAAFKRDVQLARRSILGKKHVHWMNGRGYVQAEEWEAYKKVLICRGLGNTRELPRRPLPGNGSRQKPLLIIGERRALAHEG
jgi:hypothetical protein